MFLSKMLRAVDHPYIVGPGGRKVRGISEEFNLCLWYVPAMYSVVKIFSTSFDGPEVENTLLA